MQRKMNKKGFTIVELVIVIVVIAILAAVLIPTFVSLVNKANESKDTQLVRNLNTALTADEDNDKTMSGALKSAAAFGYDVAKINASATDNEILWDSKNNVFCYLNDDMIEYIPETPTSVEASGADFWVISNKVSATYSTYLYGDVDASVAVEAIHNLDVTAFEGIDVVYKGSGTVSIYTNGGDLTVDNDAATVYHYGTADNVLIKAVDTASYHLRAEVITLEVWHGNIVPESGSVQVVIVTKGEGAPVDAIVTFNPAASSTAVINNVIIDTTANALDNTTKEALMSAVAEGGKTTEVDDPAKIEEVVAQATAFASGTGTKSNPYIIANVDQLKNISLNYETGYAYYKVADGVEVLDCSSWTKVMLNGSFDGNGVKIINLDNALFYTVGTAFDGVNGIDNIVIENLDATLNVTNGCALVRNIFNGGETTFKNVQIHGYIEGNMNMGSFYKYGTANAAGSDGCDYTVNFINSVSDATIVDTVNVPGTMIGHTYAGAGHTVTINMDEKSCFKGAVFSKQGTASELMAIPGTCILNGQAYTNKKINVNKISVVAPVVVEDGFAVEKVSGASYMIVTIGAQVTSYDAKGNMIANQAGITMNLSTAKLEELIDGANKVFDAVTGFEIVNEYLNGELGYEIVEGVLKIYVGNRNALTGNSTLQVSQYTTDGTLLATGSYVLGNDDVVQ